MQLWPGWTELSTTGPSLGLGCPRSSRSRMGQQAFHKGRDGPLGLAVSRSRLCQDGPFGLSVLSGLATSPEHGVLGRELDQ